MASLSTKLPPLRRDIRVEFAGKSRDGVQKWIIRDPLQRKYFRINLQTAEILSDWVRDTDKTAFLQHLEERRGTAINAQELDDLVSFLAQNSLLEADLDANWLQQAHDGNEKEVAGGVTAFVRRFLFLKVHLFNPNTFLKAALPITRPLFTKTAFFVIALIGAWGAFAVSKQWTDFANSANHLLSLKGTVYLLTSLVFVKVLHELGHAFTAARHGCYVPSMGIVFFALFPMLYTDVSDSWKLQSSQKRMQISSAGIVVELSIACLATALWVFIPDGDVRNVVLVLAATSWLSSLLFNLNPLMKFDGYYLLCDFLKTENLQPRAMALGQWKFRQLLIAPNLKAPEVLPKAQSRWLIIYAWSVWLYRAILFSSIAYVAYQYFFKLLGILLFCIILWSLLLRPILEEVKAWRDLQSETISQKRALFSTSAFCAFLLFFAVPWSSTVKVPAIMKAADLATLYPPSPALISDVFVQQGQPVEKGALLVQLKSPDLDAAIRATQIEIDLLSMRLKRIVVSPEDLEQSPILQDRLNALVQKMNGLRNQREQLAIRSPITGRTLELATHVRKGHWINVTKPLVIVSAQDDHVVTGYVAGADIDRLPDKATGYFIPENMLFPQTPVILDGVNATGSSQIEIKALSAAYNGPIALKSPTDDQSEPLQTQYKVSFSPGKLEAPPQMILRGVVLLEGEAVSLLGRAWKHTANILLRELSF